MAGFRKALMGEAMKVMSDPRVLKLMQDERVVKAMVVAASVPGRVHAFTSEQLERLTKAMALAKEDEILELRRAVRRLEDEVQRMRTDRADAPRSERRAPRSEPPRPSPRSEPPRPESPSGKAKGR
jgi:hypothetical protein